MYTGIIVLALLLVYILMIKLQQNRLNKIANKKETERKRIKTNIDYSIYSQNWLFYKDGKLTSNKK